MTGFRWLCLTVLGIVTIAGCGDLPDPGSATPPNENSSESLQNVPRELQAKIQSALAKLPEADQVLARAQKYCPVQKALLGTMGKPDRIEINGQPVFLCCAACADDARAEPKKTLKLVAQFKKNK